MEGFEGGVEDALLDDGCGGPETFSVVGGRHGLAGGFGENALAATIFTGPLLRKKEQ